MFLAACVQLQGSSDVQRNLRVTESLVRQAANAGAKLVATPENTTFLGPHQRKVELAEALDGPTHQVFARLAAELRIHLLIGSVAERCEEDPGRCHNTSLLFGPDGRIVSSYRKVHLFDVDVPGGVSFRESETIAPGDRAVVASTELGQLGLSVCYDLRFPGLYQALASQGAQLLCVPSAFTLMTGKDHWHALLRARAIENQCYVVAPGQWGEHDDQGLRQSYGHSLIVDPWGTVLAECGDGEGFCLAPIELEKVDRVRAGMPVQQHRRF